MARFPDFPAVPVVVHGAAVRAHHQGRRQLSCGEQLSLALGGIVVSVIATPIAAAIGALIAFALENALYGLSNARFGEPRLPMIVFGTVAGIVAYFVPMFEGMSYASCHRCYLYWAITLLWFALLAVTVGAVMASAP